MTPIEFRKVGEFDYFERVTIEADGRYAVEVGNYDAFEQRHGVVAGKLASDVETLLREASAAPGDDAACRPFTGEILVGDGRRISVPSQAGDVADPRTRLAELLQSL